MIYTEIVNMDYTIEKNNITHAPSWTCAKVCVSGGALDEFDDGMNDVAVAMRDGGTIYRG